VGLLLLWAQPAAVEEFDPTVLPAPWGDLLPVDHLTTDEDRLLVQYKEKVTVKALALAPSKNAQFLENTLFEVLVQQLLDNALGEQLNRWGRVFKIERELRGDDDYRVAIKAKVLEYRSKGHVEEIYAPFDALDPAADFYIKQWYPAAIVLRWLSPPLDRAAARVLALVLKRSRSGGVLGEFFWYPRAASGLFKFSSVIDEIESDPAHGYGNELQTTGGHLAGVIKG
jgi:hypothetical protein